jgi:uncharacterized membrane protein YjjP (DUF1212 family)
MRHVELLLVELASALHAYGTPTHRLEEALERLAGRFELPITVFATPTALQLGFGRGTQQRVHLLRVAPDDMDLGRLAELDKLVARLVGGEGSTADARSEIEGIRAAPKRYSRSAVLFSFALASATAAPMFGGGVAELLLASALAMTLAPLAGWMGRSHGSAGLFEPVASFAVALVAHAVARLTGVVSPELVVLSSLIVLVPGLRLTVALTELAAGHLVSGTARLAGAATVFLLMLLGVAMGGELVSQVLGPAPAYTPVGLSAPLVALGVCVAPVSFVVLFAARMEELGWIWIGCVAGVGVSMWASGIVGPELASFLGALAIGLIGNELDRRGRLPASVLRAPGLIMLVPGGLGLRSLEALWNDDALAGISGLFSAVLVGAALAGGMLVANLLRPPRGSL